MLCILWVFLELKIKVRQLLVDVQAILEQLVHVISLTSSTGCNCMLPMLMETLPVFANCCLVPKIINSVYHHLVLVYLPPSIP